MLSRLICYLFILSTLVSANLFDFIHQFGGAGDNGNARHQGVKNPQEYESTVLSSQCGKYLCPDTGICVDAPKFCPCPFPSSQLRCYLPNGRYVCISKPTGEGISQRYADPKTNYKIDAKDDNIRDCGWVNRAWRA